MILSKMNMAALLVCGKRQRYIAIPAGISHDDAVEFVTPFLSPNEQISGFYQFN